MAKITKKQVMDANAKLCNGFKVDIYHWAAWGEKQAVKRIPLGGNAFACFTLLYREEYEEKVSPYGCSYNVPTGRQIPCVHIAKEFKDGEFLHSYGLGEWVPVGEPQEKKLFSVLQKLSGTLDEAALLELGRMEPEGIEESRAIA